jgi:hypothetical protein|tara:strand:+ start:142 stop:687 length:546 start_codon:yes stop_codon:yes gene_type:complete
MNKAALEYPKRDTMNRYRTQSLFVETHRGQESDILEPIFTLADEDLVSSKGSFLSMKKIYLTIADPTEYAFALYTFSSWQHWEKLTRIKWFLEQFEVWRDELEVKLRSQAVSKMVRIADSSANQALQANKFLVDRGWVDKKNPRGRPSKAEKERIKKQDSQVKTQVDEDFDRVIGSIRGAA